MNEYGLVGSVSRTRESLGQCTDSELLGENQNGMDRRLIQNAAGGHIQRMATRRQAEVWQRIAGERATLLHNGCYG